MSLSLYISERIRWDKNLEQELFTNILQGTKVKNWRDLKNMTIKKETWIDISERFENSNINYERAKNYWMFLSTKLFCEKPINCSLFKLTILKA